LKYATRNFYAHGGLEAVITVQRKNREQAVSDEQVAAAMELDRLQRQKEKHEQEEKNQKQKEFDDAHRNDI